MGALLGAALVAVAGLSSTAAAQELITLHSFTGDDGAHPQADLIADPAGNLYGTTPFGGAVGQGTVFRLDSYGTVTVLYSFTGGSDGAAPVAGLIADAAGNLYGTASRGGTGTFCCGTVFQLDSSGTLTVLHSFTGGSDGGTPQAGLIADAAGNLYGTTSSGGAGYGTVFQLTPSGDLMVLHSFTLSDGTYPHAGLIADAAGNLYGTTLDGGAFGYGTVFQLAPDGTLTVLHSFTRSDGTHPFAGLLSDAAGNLYGTTQLGGAPGSCNDPDGCGTVFQLDSSGVLTVLHTFTGGSDGARPEAGLIADAAGNLYGTTRFFGGRGTVFQVTPSGTLTVLYSFTGGSDGAWPQAGLIADAAGNLYGTTSYGGTSTSCVQGCGTLFELTVPASFIGGQARRNMNTKALRQGGAQRGLGGNP